MKAGKRMGMKLLEICGNSQEKYFYHYSSITLI